MSCHGWSKNKFGAWKFSHLFHFHAAPYSFKKFDLKPIKYHLLYFKIQNVSFPTYKNHEGFNPFSNEIQPFTFLQANVKSMYVFTMHICVFWITLSGCTSAAFIPALLKNSFLPFYNFFPCKNLSGLQVKRNPRGKYYFRDRFF